ncbi:DUF3093 domain-containing protein [Nocardioides sp. Bht2]|uniref:DUF3093 domain-containing protein n=1 Tax=Nocardioides sp. Bht2 TaxID=3392297 RepID=UPI0039B581E5
MEYAERLTVPLRWWAQGTMMVASFWLAVAVVDALSNLAVFAITLVVAAVVAGGLLSYGSARIELTDSELVAGRAHIARKHLGTATPLDADQAHRAAGVDADARAFLVLRPYLKRAVRVEITDPADPTPYWLISTRHPKRLARALNS